MYNDKHFLLAALLNIIGLVACIENTYYCENKGQPVVISGVNSGRIKTLVNGTVHYGKRMKCTWIIKAGRNPYKRIQVSVIESDLQWTSSDAICPGKDFMDVRDGEFPDSGALVTWCGEMNPYSFVSRGSSMYITFSTDDRHIYNERGVTLDFTLFGESECPLGYILNGKYCYGFKEHSETWTNAQQYCNKDQANLVSFETAEEAEFIAAQAKVSFPSNGVEKIWIGMHDITKEGVYEWIDEVKPSGVKLNWYVIPHTNAVYLDCIVMRREDGFWEEEFCTEDEVQTTKKYPFVCKRKLDGLTTIYPIPRASHEKEGNKGTLPPKALIIALTIVAVIFVIGLGFGVYILIFKRENCVTCFSRREQPCREVCRTDDAEEQPPTYDEVVKGTI